MRNDIINYFFINYLKTRTQAQTINIAAIKNDISYDHISFELNNCVIKDFKKSAKLNQLKLGYAFLELDLQNILKPKIIINKAYINDLEINYIAQTDELKKDISKVAIALPNKLRQPAGGRKAVRHHALIKDLRIDHVKIYTKNLHKPIKLKNIHLTNIDTSDKKSTLKLIRETIDQIILQVTQKTWQKTIKKLENSIKKRFNALVHTTP